MSREAFEALMDRWMNDPSFREEMRADPEEAVQRSGLELDEGEWAAVRRMLMTLPDEQLKTRTTK